MRTLLEKLTVVASNFLKKEYGLILTVPIRVSSRMTTKLGAFVTKANKPHEIIISKNLLENYSEDTIVDVLKHECVHYALCSLGYPYRDGQAKFEMELKRLGVSSTYTYSFKGTVHLYACKKCNVVFHKKMKGYEKRYCCAKCRRKFKYLGEKHIK